MQALVEEARPKVGEVVQHLLEAWVEAAAALSPGALVEGEAVRRCLALAVEVVHHCLAWVGEEEHHCSALAVVEEATHCLASGAEAGPICSALVEGVE